MSELQNRPEFLAELPASLDIPANTRKVIVTEDFHTAEINVEADSELIFLSLVTKDIKEKQTLTVNLNGANSTVNVIVLAIGTDEKFFDFETISQHNSPHTNAYYWIRSALFDKSHINYRGNLVIPKNAQITDAYLTHNSLMLSPNAKTDTEPCLEIEADDVQAGHAATIGNIDDELLFYFQSRGMDKRLAQQALIRGFIEAELHRLPDESLRQAITAEIEKFIPDVQPTTA